MPGIKLSHFCRSIIFITAPICEMEEVGPLTLFQVSLDKALQPEYTAHCHE